MRVEWTVTNLSVLSIYTSIYLSIYLRRRKAGAELEGFLIVGAKIQKSAKVYNLTIR